jgi:hypothetical protein
MTAAYRRRPTNKVMPVGMNYLSDLVIRPGIEKRLWPLCLYRGRMSPGHAHRLWNFALLMMAAECETLADGIKIAHNAAFAQLCGPVRVPLKTTLNSYFGRLWDSPDVTDNISGLTEYVKSLELGPSTLRPVPLETDQQFCAPWRTSTHPEFDKNADKPESGARALYYPYLAHDPKSDDGHALVLLANKLVPHTLPHDIRADVCQELIVSILSGQITRDQAADHVQKHIGRVFKSVEFKYTLGGLKTSFDAPHDVLSDGLYQHWSEQMEDGNAENT